MKNINIDLVKPSDKELEITTIGPGFNNGESVVIHLGNGKWMIIDSCKANGEVLPLAYLDAIGVSCDDVKTVICSHWHKDHYLGLAEILRSCKNSEFKIAKIGNFKNFVKYVFMLNEIETNKAGGWKEFEKCLIALKEVGQRKPKYIFHDQLIEDNDQIKIDVHCLGPSDYAMEQFDSLLLQIDPKDPKEEHTKALEENMTCLSVTVSYDGQAVLIGCDAEVNRRDKYSMDDCTDDCEDAKETGWCEIMHNSIILKRNSPFGCVKIAHHSSVTGYCPKFWKELVKKDALIGVTTIYKSSNSENLPHKDMLSQYHTHCTHQYITCGLEQNVQPTEVFPGDDTILDITKQDLPGIVVCRWSPDEKKWKRYTFGAAAEVTGEFLKNYHKNLVD